MVERKLPSLQDMPPVSGKYVLVRASLNVPVAEGIVSNEFRIARALPTINKLRAAGARVIVAAHIGRESEETLRPVFEVLQGSLPITFSEKIVGREVLALRDQLKDGEVLLLENLRRDPGEKINDKNLAADLAALADYYVNDAFAASHRAHASLVGVPALLPSFFGLNFIHEYEELKRVMEPVAPALFVLGGAKFDTKLPLVEEYLETYDHVIIGGALANDFYKGLGYEVGTSLVSDIDLSDSPLLKHKKIILPEEVVVDGPEGRRVSQADAVASNEAILDAGPGFIDTVKELVLEAKTILWNGPLGNFEAGYGEQTTAFGRLVASAPGHSLLGGGDTIAAIEALGCQEKYGFLSTAGGAMLTFLETKTLPAIDAIIDKS